MGRGLACWEHLLVIGPYTRPTIDEPGVMYDHNVCLNLAFTEGIQKWEVKLGEKLATLLCLV